MIVESTWHPNARRRTQFVWEATDDGIRLFHGNGNPLYIIPWTALKAVLDETRRIAAASPGGVVVAGCSQTTPPAGSVGAWVMKAKLKILPSGNLTPQHLSFIGPILGRMQHIKPVPGSRSIHWTVV